MVWNRNVIYSFTAAGQIKNSDKRRMQRNKNIRLGKS